MPQFSIVIPLFNKEKNIKKTINSVLNQSKKDFELIIVDDGSTDGSYEAAKNFKNDNIYIFKKINGGVSSARNFGILKSKSEYVAFLDADDFWLPNHLEELSKLIEAFPDKCLLSTSHKIIENEKTLNPNTGFGENYFGEINSIYDAFSKELSIVNSSCACIKKSAIKNTGLFPENIKYGEDIIFWIRVANYGGFAHSGKRTSVYFKDATNRTIHVKHNEIPYHLKWISDEIMNNRSLEEGDKDKMLAFFKRAVVFTAAGSKINNNIEAIELIMKLPLVKKMRSLYLTMAFLKLMPNCILLFAKKFRHKREI